MAHPSSYYRDPAEHILFEREKSCTGCIYQNGKSKCCMIGGATYPKRCEQFAEITTTKEHKWEYAKR